jgi:uncharacterized protein (UPF0332 family)
MDPVEFHRFAERIIRGGGKVGPVECRVAISRAYYGAFNVAFGLLVAAGFNFFPKDDKHKIVARHLLWCEDAEVKRVGSTFDSFRAIRNHADYDMNYPGVERLGTAEIWLDESADCIRTLEAAFGGPNRASIVASIRKGRDAVYGVGN